MSERIPKDVRQFIDRYVDSVVEVEALVLLLGAGCAMTAEQVAQSLRIDARHAEQQLGHLVRARILRQSDDAYVYAPSDGRLRDTAEELASLYRTHRVAITALVYARPSEQIRSFSDAFRLRKEPD